MTTIDPNSAQTALFEKLGISKQSEAQKATKDTLGQSDFLKLMTTQLQNQDPFAPMDNGDFIAQMAQFSTVTGIEEVNGSLKRLVEELNEKFIVNVKSYINKIDNSIQEFRFNVSIALFYEVYNYFKTNLEKNIGKKVFQAYLIDIMKLMIPFAPHISFECLELLKCKNVESWPNIESNIIEELSLAVQINGKTRDVIKIKKDLLEKEVSQIISKSSKANKYLENKKVVKTIFVKNKIINYIIQNK